MNRKPAHPTAEWPRQARTAAAVIAAAVLALLAAACGGSPSAAGSGGSPATAGPATAPSAVSYSHCMRSGGVPDYPDPGSSGSLPKTSAQELGVSTSQYQAAQRACQHLLPGNGGTLSAASLRQCELTGNCPQALVRQALSEGVNFARCLRAHGLPNWPDPSTDSEGRPYFDLSAHGFSRQQAHSPQVRSRASECRQEMPGLGGLPFG